MQQERTAVPALTYANSVTMISARLRKRRETLQREAERGASEEPNSDTAIEAIEFQDGELGW